MSRPAVSWARRKDETASSYCSRYLALTIASRKLFEPSEAVYQAGRGSEPMIEVGMILPSVALNMDPLPGDRLKRLAAQSGGAVGDRQAGPARASFAQLG